MKSTLTMTMYQVCDNEHGTPFNSEGCTMHPSKRKALAELRETRKHFPEVYLAQIIYTRIPESSLPPGLCRLEVIDGIGNDRPVIAHDAERSVSDDDPIARRHNGT